METLSGGGTASGPLSFMRGFDAFAGVIKSGGKTRRAAKMVILNVDHPDIVDFIECKAKEEAKAWTLMQAGYDGSGPDSEAYSSIFFQNANNSVRVTDEFMHAVENDGDFTTRTVKDGAARQGPTRPATSCTRSPKPPGSAATPACSTTPPSTAGTPRKNTGRINASNPCSEYMFLDDSACNLASFNLLKFLTPAGTLRHRRPIATPSTSSSPRWRSSSTTPATPPRSIARNSHDYRPLGLGYANLGALLMAFGLPYDSDAGRDFAATLTAILCGEAYLQSARIAETCPSPRRRHAAHRKAAQAQRRSLPRLLRQPRALPRRHPHASRRGQQDRQVAKARSRALHHPAARASSSPPAKTAGTRHSPTARSYGYRNSQVTVLAPTGTIGFMMDCDTTGIEPDLALVKYKKLVGGGMIKIVNNTVPAALFKLGYTDAEVDAIVSYIDATGTIEGAPAIKPEHLAVFDCSFKPAKGTRSIHYMGHIKMMAATQPFLSGAISKTVNLPHDCTVDDIAEAYIEAWRLGLKAVAIYRDGSKGAQPLNVSDGEKQGQDADATTPSPPPPTAFSPRSPPGRHPLRRVRRRPQDPEPPTATRSPTASRSPPSPSPPPRSLRSRHHQRRRTRRSAAPCRHAAIAAASRLSRRTRRPPRAIRHRLPEERASAHPQVLPRRTRGLHHRRPLPQRPARRNLHPHGQGRLHRLRTHGLLRHRRLARPPARRPAQGPRARNSPTPASSPPAGPATSRSATPSRIMDYIFRWLQLRFLSGHQLSLFNMTGATLASATMPLPSSVPVEGTIGDLTAASALAAPPSIEGAKPAVHVANAMKDLYDMGDAPSCHTCGAIMVRNGSCYRCMSCG